MLRQDAARSLLREQKSADFLGVGAEIVSASSVADMPQWPKTFLRRRKIAARSDGTSPLIKDTRRQMAAAKRIITAADRIVLPVASRV
jgi:hypothetical protein